MLKDKVLISPALPVYRANLHCHTVISDGEKTPAQIKTDYQSQGYSIVAYTDHRIYQWHKDLTDDNFLALAAFEVDINDFPKIPGDFSPLATYHLNLFDTDPEKNREEKELSPLPPQRYGDITAINGYIQEMNALGFLCCYNHPYWSLQNHEDYKNLRGLFAMEIYNHGCEHDGLYGYHPQAYDEMLRTGQRLHCLATDDNHNRCPDGDPLSDSYGGWVNIHCETLSYPCVIQALKEGSFTFSMGPAIKSLTLEQGILKVETSPVEKIFVVQQGRDCYKKLAPKGETITQAQFPLTGKEGWFRLDCRDERGLHTGTNVYFIEDLI